MKIAIACNKNIVAEHFGHCEDFAIYDLENKKIVAKNVLPNPGHKPGFLPNYLNDLGVKIIIAGGMGKGAIDIFEEKNIEVITGAAGDIDMVMQAKIADTLVSSAEICKEHNHN